MTKRNVRLVFLFALWMVACQGTSIIPTATTSPTSQPIQPLPGEPSPTTTQPLIPSATSGPQQPTATFAPPGEPLPAFIIDWAQPFAAELMTGERIVLATWTPQPYAGEDIALPLNLNQVVNANLLDGLTADQKAFLAANGFVVIHSQEAQFGDIRVETAKRTGQPYYLTTDAAFHALHLLFDELLQALEQEHFRPQMIAITKATLEQVRSDFPAVQGTSLATDAQQAIAYLSVALKLLDPAAEIDPAVADIVSQQVEQIIAADGRATSRLFPDFEDDYAAYKPVGHYAGNPDLEAYFRAMTWYGRMHFLLQNPADPSFTPSRLPLIVTLALRSAQLDGRPASDAWADLHNTLDFMVGPSDDAGPLEYAALMDQVYGDKLQIQGLADEALWQEFLSRSDQLPAPQINSLFVASTVDLSPEKGWRFMGQRFTLDGMIFQNLIFDRVQARPDGTQRDLPSGLDVMAAFGSFPAFQELDQQGITTFPNYNDQLEKMQQAVLAQPEEQWLRRFYDGWLYSFFPLVQAKDSAYPAYMQTTAWSYKDLNTALGSWAELKHDTALYTKMPEAAGGGGPPMSGPAPSYVEPNPQPFYRMAYIALTLSCGLQERVLYEPCYLGGYASADAAGYIYGMGSLAQRFTILGDIAAKELAGQPLDEDENTAITGCLGMIECLNLDSPYSWSASEMPEVPIIAAVSGSPDKVLEVGVGNVDRIYVVVPLEGKWEVAQGGVFSYYEFEQPRSQRLTDDEWRAKLAAGEVALPAWAANFVLPGGQPVESLFFRVGDVYFITEAGDKLNVRDQPSLNGTVIAQLATNDYIEIVDGPIQANGYTWWKIELYSWGDPTVISGWAVEDPQWYARSYLP
ncbi:MAG: DUF3160 domain-containing protein [Anaerolineales bacterium]|nr:DUF3160 domain-containing protein [Anaerolineales bacterium]